jgi:cytoskeletal protein CcmA (bactofilin family)
MPWQWLEKRSGEGEDWTGFLERGVKLRGELAATGTFRINSTVVGKLSSDGTLILGEQSDVDGEIEGRVVLMGGKFNGTVRSSERVEIQATGVVQGEIYSPCVNIAAGAIFQGRCHMPSQAPPFEPLTIQIRSAVQS